LNDAPQGTSKSFSIPEDPTAAYKFSVADFGFFDPSDSPPFNAQGDNFKSVTLIVPSTGVLSLAGAQQTAGATITVTAAQLNATPGLTFTGGSDLNGNNLSTISFQVTDDGSTANANDKNTDPNPKVLTISVLSVNDPPDSGLTSTTTAVEDTPYPI